MITLKEFVALSALPWRKVIILERKYYALCSYYKSADAPRLIILKFINDIANRGVK